MLDSDINTCSKKPDLNATKCFASSYPAHQDGFGSYLSPADRFLPSESMIFRDRKEESLLPKV